MKTLAVARTPSLVLDRPRLLANAGRMLRRARALGVRLRPHLKTLKSIDAARLAIDPVHGGIAAATLNEAAYFAGHGIRDIQIAVCLSPDKLLQVAEIQRQAPELSFFLDSSETARAAADIGQSTGVPLRAWIEIDCGGNRTGIPADSPELLDIAGVFGAHVRLEGVATHAGQSYADLATPQIAAVAEVERIAVVSAADRLRSAGYVVPGVSAGSTPTTMHAHSATGLTEWRAGVYLAGDLFQAAVGSLAAEDIAVSVLATVISHKKRSGQIVVDAGGLALSKDRSTASLSGRDGGYGLVTDIAGRAQFGELHVVEVHQEHGVIRGVSDALFAALPIGTRVRILPNHVCMTAAMYPEYLVTDGDLKIVAHWPRTNGWT